MRVGILVLTVLCCTIATRAMPQAFQLADGAAPRFYTEPGSGSPGTPRDDAREASVFKRHIALDLRGVPLADALEEIARCGGLPLSFSRALLPADAHVTLSTPDITVGGALTAVLYDRGVDVQLALDGLNAALVSRTAVPALRIHRVRQGAGTITGRVTDAKTGQVLPNVTVTVEATNRRATTTNDGRYTVSGIAAGVHAVAARLLGHTPQTRVVTVTSDSITRIDFALAEAAAALEQVVTTAVGDQRKVELGNSIATINADSVVRTAPVTELTDVLSGRAPGVQVLQDQGQVGGGVRLRIRGVSSFTLSNDPIIYVDGVRLDGSGGPVNGASPSTFAPFPVPSRLNDIDPADVESIDVLKGPSAATEYGTDAASGVIVIKTKRGRAGAPHWDFHVEQGQSDMPARFPVGWHAFGHTTDGTATPVECPRTYGGGGPTVSSGGCVIDSVRTYQPLNHASTSIFGTGDVSRVGAQLSGGTQQLQYFLGGAYDNMTGVLQLPPFYRQQLTALGQSIPGYMQRPNTMDQANTRGRVSTTLGNAADVGFSATYTSNNQRSGNVFVPLLGAALTTGNRNDGFGGYGVFGGVFLPTSAFATTGSEGIRRFTGSTNGTWRPASWLSTRATVGIDLGNRTDDSYQAPGPDPIGFTSFPGSSGTGYHGIGRVATMLYTADIGATATAPLSTTILSKTSAGFQYNIRSQTGTLAQAYGLTANGSLNGASIYQARQLDSAAKTLGSYIEESVGWRDRLFLTGAMRVDAGSGFGSQVNAAAYPKASLSWAVIQAPSHRLRLRAAYGESGLQPPNGATLSLLAPATVMVGGNSVSGDTATIVGNPDLKPERSAELETGFDAGILNDRLTVEFTYYRKQTHNTIVSNILAGSEGSRIQYENLGSVLNYGVEGSLTVQPLDSRYIGWDVTLGGSLNQNRLVSLAPGVPPINATFFPTLLQYRQVAGYPLFGLWAPHLQYADANHDGIIEPDEVSESSVYSYVGSSTPTREFTLNTGLSLFGRAVRIGTQIDSRGGYKIQNKLLAQIEGLPTAAAFNDPHASLHDQARAVESSQTVRGISDAYFEDGSFVRWRELSVTYFLPDRVIRFLHVRSSSITALGRNLSLWTRYLGADPEVTSVGTVRGGPPDGVYDYGATPLARSWAIRANLGL